MWYGSLYSNKLHYIYAEYNPFWCYMGWWLYAAPIVTEPHHHPGVIDREEWPSRSNAAWLNYDWRLDALMLALELPQLHDYRGSNHTASIRKFLERCPIGVLCSAEDGGRKFTVENCDALWDYARIVKELQLLDMSAVSEKRIEQIEELERQLKPACV
ncbi:hypothetical protein ES703_47194 [subsurface metagenome]